jgi:peptidoglycan L-alanyl-D-glutamate endopeptidase CwlK
VWGPKTEAATKEWDRAFDLTATFPSSFDLRTETLIYTLLPAAQKLARRLLVELHRRDIDARIISGTRTYAEQSAIFLQGRYNNPGRVVTYARAGQSNHNFGMAWDIGIFDAQGRYLDGDQPAELVPYERAGEISRAIPGLEWGGDWPGKKRDLPHYQLAVKWSLAQVRAKFERGEAFT